jgi:hypothetical protein
MIKGRYRSNILFGASGHEAMDFHFTEALLFWQ